MVLLETRTLDGKLSRRCDARCHRAKPLPKGRPCPCICGGMFRGIERNGIDPKTISTGYLNVIRSRIELREGETLQLRFGA